MKWGVTLAVVAAIATAIPAAGADWDYPQLNGTGATPPAAVVPPPPPTPAKGSCPKGTLAKPAKCADGRCGEQRSCWDQIKAFVCYSPTAGDALPKLHFQPYMGPFSGTFFCLPTAGGACGCGSGVPYPMARPIAPAPSALPPGPTTLPSPTPVPAPGTPASRSTPGTVTEQLSASHGVRGVIPPSSPAAVSPNAMPPYTLDSAASYVPNATAPQRVVGGLPPSSPAAVSPNAMPPYTLDSAASYVPNATAPQRIVGGLPPRGCQGGSAPVTLPEPQWHQDILPQSPVDASANVHPASAPGEPVTRQSIKLPEIPAPQPSVRTPQQTAVAIPVAPAVPATPAQKTSEEVVEFRPSRTRVFTEPAIAAVQPASGVVSTAPVTPAVVVVETSVVSTPLGHLVALPADTLLRPGSQR